MGRHVGEGIKAFEVEQFLPISVGTLGLRPPIVHVEAVAGGNPLHHSVENLPVVLVLIEPEMDEVVQRPARLRGGFGVDAVDATLDRIWRTGFVVRRRAQE